MKNILETARSHHYNSIQYIEDEDIADAIIYKVRPGLLVLYKESDGLIVIYWATNSKEEFITELKDFISYASVNFLNKSVQIGFIPKEFIKELQEMGFYITCEWVDFWNYDLKIPCFQFEKQYVVRPINLLMELSIVGAITRSCSGSSRGFKGESDEWVKEWGESKDSNIFVIEDGNQVIGACFTRLYGFESEKGTVLWVRELVVHPSCQSKGVGKVLLKHVIEWGKSNGAMRSFLACDSENYNAIKLYEYFGYISNREHSEINMLIDWELVQGQQLKLES